MPALHPCSCPAAGLSLPCGHRAPEKLSGRAHGGLHKKEPGRSHGTVHRPARGPLRLHSHTHPLGVICTLRGPAGTVTAAALSNLPVSWSPWGHPRLPLAPAGAPGEATLSAPVADMGRGGRDSSSRLCSFPAQIREAEESEVQKDLAESAFPETGLCNSSSPSISLPSPFALLGMTLLTLGLSNCCCRCFLILFYKVLFLPIHRKLPSSPLAFQLLSMGRADTAGLWDLRQAAMNKTVMPTMWHPVWGPTWRPRGWQSCGIVGVEET